jgi:hypothetical protein
VKNEEIPEKRNASGMTLTAFMSGLLSGKKGKKTNENNT